MVMVASSVVEVVGVVETVVMGAAVSILTNLTSRSFGCGSAVTVDV